MAYSDHNVQLGFQPPISPPSLIPFSFEGPDYPQQVLVMADNGSQYLGESLDILQDLPITQQVPIAVDSIGRMTYWYSRSDNLIFKHSLHRSSLSVGARITMYSGPSHIRTPWDQG